MLKNPLLPLNGFVLLKVLKNVSIKISGRQPSKKLKWYGLL